MKKNKWVENPTKNQVWLVLGSFVLALVLISAAGTDLYSHSFDFDRFFVLGMIMILNFLLVVRVVANYFKNKSANK